ncbi:MAG: hypothetical protein JJE22_06800, partial [Bacteroidia bacterium]|nr:hypothetical protein [Bacteroidia bacterium]
NQIENFYSQKIITPTINPKGRVLIGRDTLAIDQLADELQNPSWKSFLGTGKMFDTTRLETVTGVEEGVIESVKNVIHKANKNKIERRFPVLFQLNYQ